MSLVNVHNEWDPLEEVIFGRAHNARIARPDKGLFAVGGGFHCVTLDVRRKGALETYCSAKLPRDMFD